MWANDFGTDIGPPLTFPDTLEHDDDDGGPTFEWDVNPSTRPVVAGRMGAPRGRRRRRTSSSSTRRAARPRTPATRPAGRTRRSLRRRGPAGRLDNGRLNVHIDWANPRTTGTSTSRRQRALVASSAAFGDTTEDAILFDPPAGQYTAVIVNYDQVDGPAVGRLGQRSRRLREPAPAHRDGHRGGLEAHLPSPAAGGTPLRRHRRPRRARQRRRRLRRDCGGAQALTGRRAAAGGPRAARRSRHTLDLG